MDSLRVYVLYVRERKPDKLLYLTRTHWIPPPRVWITTVISAYLRSLYKMATNKRMYMEVRQEVVFATSPEHHLMFCMHRQHWMAYLALYPHPVLVNTICLLVFCGVPHYTSVVYPSTPVWCTPVPQCGVPQYPSVVYSSTPVWCIPVPQCGVPQYPSVLCEAAMCPSAGDLC